METGCSCLSTPAAACRLDFGFVVRLHMYGAIFETTNILSKQLQDPSLDWMRAGVLARSQATRVRQLSSDFDTMWVQAGTAMSELKEDMQGATSLLRQTRATKKSVARDKLRVEFASTCNIVAEDMEARFCTSDHEVMVRVCKLSILSLPRC